MLPLSKGSSLLREWRGVRNCRTLPIPSQYCICQYNWTVVSDAKLLKDLGDFLAEQLNQQLTNAGLRNKCQKQSYESVSKVQQLLDGSQTLYDVIVYLSPSGGLFSVRTHHPEPITTACCVPCTTCFTCRRFDHGVAREDASTVVPVACQSAPMDLEELEARHVAVSGFS